MQAPKKRNPRVTHLLQFTFLSSFLFPFNGVRVTNQNAGNSLVG